MGNFLTKLIQGLQVTQPTLEAGITAGAGGTFAAAYKLTKQLSIISVAATTNDSVVVPVLLSPNIVVQISNKGANTIRIYPPAGGTLGAGANTALTLAAGSTMQLITNSKSDSLVSYARVITFATT